jgi:hypothetical protein
MGFTVRPVYVRSEPCKLRTVGHMFGALQVEMSLSRVKRSLNSEVIVSALELGLCFMTDVA